MTRAPVPVVELRRYTLKPGRRADLLALFRDHFSPAHHALGMHLLGPFEDAADPDAIVWVRGFDSWEARAQQLDAFYGGEVWRVWGPAANDTMVDSDDVHLLAPVAARGLPSVFAEPAGGGWLVTVVGLPGDRTQAEADLPAGTAVADDPGAWWFQSSPEPNNFPRLPVRDDRALVRLAPADARRTASGGRHAVESVVAALPGAGPRIEDFVLREPSPGHGLEKRTSGFDFLVGDWTVSNRRLRRPLSGRSDDWYTCEAEARSFTLHDGSMSIDEMTFASEGFVGSAVRLHTPHDDTWSIYWVDSRTGHLQPPVRGRWSEDGSRFEGEGTDVVDGSEVLVRFLWHQITDTGAVWEQSFSADDGVTWELNWVMTWRRV